MADLPQPSTLLQPDIKSNTFTPSKAKSLTPNTFTGIVDTSDAAVERRFKGNFNLLRGTDLYNRRFQANLALDKLQSSGYAEWNRRRQNAIDRGEDPNAELIAKIEARKPDSYLERTWRKLSGRKKTKAEEKEDKEAREGKAMGANVRSEHEDVLEAVEIYDGLGREKEDDDIVR